MDRQMTTAYIALAWHPAVMNHAVLVADLSIFLCSDVPVSFYALLLLYSSAMYFYIELLVTLQRVGAGSM